MASLLHTRKKFKSNDEVIAETKPILTRKRNRTIKEVSKSWKIAILVVSLSKATMLNNKIKFCQNFVFFILIE